MSPGKHGPNRVASYVALLETNVDQVVRGGFVSSHDLRVIQGHEYVSVRGNVQCSGGIVIEVMQIFEIVDGKGKGRKARARIARIAITCSSRR